MSLPRGARRVLFSAGMRMKTRILCKTCVNKIQWRHPTKVRIIGCRRFYLRCAVVDAFVMTVSLQMAVGRIRPRRPPCHKLFLAVPTGRDRILTAISGAFGMLVCPAPRQQAASYTPSFCRPCRDIASPSPRSVPSGTQKR